MKINIGDWVLIHPIGESGRVCNIRMDERGERLIDVIRESDNQVHICRDCEVTKIYLSVKERVYLSVKERVQNGVKWLDSVDDKWRDKVDISKLDIMSGDTCIIGQVFGSYFDFFMTGPLRGNQRFSMGFVCGSLESVALEQAWKEELK